MYTIDLSELPKSDRMCEHWGRLSVGGAAAKPQIDFSDWHRKPFFLIDPRNIVQTNEDFNTFFFLRMRSNDSFTPFSVSIITGRILYLILNTIGATVEEIFNMLLKTFRHS